MESTVHHASDRLIKLDSRSPVRFVGLLSLLAVAFVLFRILWPLRWSLIALWVAVEFMFYIFYWRPRYAELNKQPTAHKPKAVKAMKNFERCIQYFRETPDLDTEMYYTGWFCGAQISQIKRGEPSSNCHSVAHSYQIILAPESLSTGLQVMEVGSNGPCPGAAWTYLLSTSVCSVLHAAFIVSCSNHLAGANFHLFTHGCPPCAAGNLEEFLAYAFWYSTV